MMQCKLSSVVALLLLLFTGTSLGFGGCYKGGKTWGDVGNEDEVNIALAGLCKNLAGSCALHSQVYDCQNVNGHGIHGIILPVMGPRGRTGVEITEDACMDLVNQVKARCSLGGDLGLLATHPEKYGGDWFRANVILDPNWDAC